jgi:hypothetical protein
MSPINIFRDIAKSIYTKMKFFNQQFPIFAYTDQSYLNVLNCSRDTANNLPKSDFVLIETRVYRGSVKSHLQDFYKGRDRPLEMSLALQNAKNK